MKFAHARSAISPHDMLHSTRHRVASARVWISPMNIYMGVYRHRAERIIGTGPRVNGDDSAAFRVVSIIKEHCTADCATSGVRASASIDVKLVSEPRRCTHITGKTNISTFAQFNGCEMMHSSVQCARPLSPVDARL